MVLFKCKLKPFSSRNVRFEIENGFQKCKTVTEFSQNKQNVLINQSLTCI